MQQSEEMEKYVGTKLINAMPMTRQAYNDLRGWKLPEDENGADEGYLVEYVDGGLPNVKGFAGYVSWSPVDVFERSYHTNGSLTFGEALIALKNGSKVCRAGWNGKDQWVTVSANGGRLTHSSAFWSENNKAFAESQEHLNGYVMVNPCFTLKNAQNEIQMGWVPSVSDCLTEDWVILE